MANPIEEAAARTVDLGQLAREAAARGEVGALWSLASGDLNLNLVRLAPGEAIAPHVNDEVDVLGLVIAGEGLLEVGERREALRPGMLFLVPKGARRGLRATTSELIYVTCHRRRGYLTVGRGGRR